MKITCICGSTTQEFKHLADGDFPNGWEGPCCKVDKILEGRSVVEPAQAKPLLEQFLDGTGLRNRTRNSVWVASRSIYMHYKMWLRMRGFERFIPTMMQNFLIESQSISRMRAIGA